MILIAHVRSLWISWLRRLPGYSTSLGLGGESVHATRSEIFPSRPTTSTIGRAKSPSAHATTELEVPFMTNPLPTPIHNQQPATSNQQPAANRSTGPRTAAGKRRSSMNALTHGLTSRSPVLATEDPAAYQCHSRQFFDEYQPATPTETQLTQELIDTAWRLNRIPALEAALLDRAANPPTDQARIDFDIVDAHRALATLGLHYQRLSRQFQKAVDHLREIQSNRRHDQERALKRAAALLELHKHKGIPYDPSELFSETGFVFSKDQVEAYAQHLIRLNESRHIEHVRFYMQPPARVASASY